MRPYGSTSGGRYGPPNGTHCGRALFGSCFGRCNQKYKLPPEVTIIGIGLVVALATATRPIYFAPVAIPSHFKTAAVLAGIGPALEPQPPEYGRCTDVHNPRDALAKAAAACECCGLQDERMQASQ